MIPAIHSFCMRKIAVVDKEETDLLIQSCSPQNPAYAKSNTT